MENDCYPSPQTSVGSARRPPQTQKDLGLTGLGSRLTASVGSGKSLGGTCRKDSDTQGALEKAFGLPKACKTDTGSPAPPLPPLQHRFLVLGGMLAQLHVFVQFSGCCHALVCIFNFGGIIVLAEWFLLSVFWGVATV